MFTTIESIMYLYKVQMSVLMDELKDSVKEVCNHKKRSYKIFLK